jgi:cobalt-zinc-cadmium efflux system membrane fusion protein
MNTKSLHKQAWALWLALMLGVAACDSPEPAAEAEAEDHTGQGHETAAAAPAADWCAEHAIADSDCPFCNPGLVEARGWCAEHDVAEALCWVCSPALVAAYEAVGDWCGEHGVPESRCVACNPGLAAAATAPGDPDPDLQALPRAQRPPTVTCTKQNLTVNFEREEIAAEAGLGFETVRVEPVTRRLECNAIVAYDGNRKAQLAPQGAGTVASVDKDLGAAVAAGEVLATVVSPAFGSAKAAYLQAFAEVSLWEQNHARETDLLAQGVATERDVLEARSRLAESRIAQSRAEQELLGLGLSPAQLAAVAREGDTTSRYRIIAPFAGVVVERWAALGEVSDPARPLFTVADVSRMWALLDVYDSDVREIRAGQPVVLHVEGLPGEPFAGTVTWVSTQLDPRTRTLQARAEFENPGGLLKANMFAKAVVTVRQQQPTVIVPRAAVQWEGCCNVVFVRQSATQYQPRKVHLGPASGTMYEVVSGLKGGESVVTQGSFLLKTEILKGSIGAGCCEAQPGK